jgi:hypothetical protein
MFDTIEDTCPEKKNIAYTSTQKANAASTPDQLFTCR